MKVKRLDKRFEVYEMLDTALEVLTEAFGKYKVKFGENLSEKELGPEFNLIIKAVKRAKVDMEYLQFDKFYREKATKDTLPIEVIRKYRAESHSRMSIAALRKRVTRKVKNGSLPNISRRDKS